MFSLCFVEINPDGYSLCPTASTEIATGTDATANSTTHSNEISSHQESCLWPNALQVIFFFSVSRVYWRIVPLLSVIKEKMCDILISLEERTMKTQWEDEKEVKTRITIHKCKLAYDYEYFNIWARTKKNSTHYWFLTKTR